MSFRIKTISIVLSLSLVALCAGASYRISSGLTEVADLASVIDSGDLAMLTANEEVKAAFDEQLRAESGYLSGQWDAQRKTAGAEVAAAKEARLTWWTKLEHMAGKEAQTAERLRALAQEFSKYDQLSARLERMPADQSSEATNLFHGEMASLALRISTVLDDLMKKETADASARLKTVKELSLAICRHAALALAGVCAISILLLAYAVIRIANPLSRLAVALNVLANDVLETDIPSTHRKDEIGDTARAVALIKVRAAEKAIREVEEREVAARESSAERKAEMLRLADGFHEAATGVIDTVLAASSKLESAAGILSATAEVTQELSTMAASSSSETSLNVRGVAAASEELAATVDQIGRQVQDSSDIATRAVDQASKTNERMVELAESASRIGSVVELISSIAGQTNLLALNATIEAARAGEAGRGFAVVAQEVKALAEQTGKATSEISLQVSNMQSATQDAVDAIRDIAVTIGRISSISGAIATAVERQGVMTREISTNVADAARGTANVESSITDVSMGASETTTASAEVLSSAKRLAAESNALRDQVDQFLVAVRAA